MKVKHFIRFKEDFIRENCQTEVKGTGYTNHCQNCLWSRHVDKETLGDRASPCGGLMEPVGVEIKNDGYTLTHRCQKCGKISKNKASEKDNFKAILRLSKQG